MNLFLIFVASYHRHHRIKRKTTTTTLLGELLSAADYSTHVGGNISRPLVEVAGELEQHSWAVMELSSFQLELLQRSPEIALITNITPNHLDIHLSMDDYIQAKSHVLPINTRMIGLCSTTTTRLPGGWRLKRRGEWLGSAENRSLIEAPALSINVL